VDHSCAGVEEKDRERLVTPKKNPFKRVVSEYK
jgi:hypothetical protein